MSIDSHQLRPLSKHELFLKERICSQRELILSFKRSSLWYGNSMLSHYVISLECVHFSLRTCVTAKWEIRQCLSPQHNKSRLIVSSVEFFRSLFDSVDPDQTAFIHVGAV